MAQNPGVLNTAPSPIPGGFGNPTGINIGLPSTSPLTGVPPSFGTIPTGLTAKPIDQPNLPQSFFPANTGGTVPVGLSGLTSGFSTGDPGRTADLYNWLGKAYGKGPGQLLGNMITQGLFNPQVAQALMQAMEPTIQRGFQDVLGAFGSEGARFSSSAAIGAGDYMSQARLGQTAQLANLYQTDVQDQLQLLESVLPQIQKERASGGGLFNKILGGLETAGGIIAAPFTGGATIPLISAGINTMTGTSGGGGGANPFSGLSSLFQPQQQTPISPATSYPGMPTSAPDPFGLPPSAFSQPDILTAEAGSVLGPPSGSSFMSGESGGMPTQMWQQMFPWLTPSVGP